MATFLPHRTNTTALAAPYVTFCLGAQTYGLGTERYGISVLKLRDLIQQATTTAEPQMPAYLKGFVNLRGKIIPLVDLRAKLGGRNGDTTDHSCIVVLQLAGTDHTPHAIGLVVDGVREVTNLTTEVIQAAPEGGVNLDPAYLLGMAKIKRVVQALLDLSKAVSDETVAPGASPNSHWDYQREQEPLRHNSEGAGNTTLTQNTKAAGRTAPPLLLPELTSAGCDLPAL